MLPASLEGICDVELKYNVIRLKSFLFRRDLFVKRFKLFELTIIIFFLFAGKSITDWYRNVSIHAVMPTFCPDTGDCSKSFLTPVEPRKYWLPFRNFLFEFTPDFLSILSPRLFGNMAHSSLFVFKNYPLKVSPQLLIHNTTKVIYWIQKLLSILTVSCLSFITTTIV